RPHAEKPVRGEVGRADDEDVWIASQAVQVPPGVAPAIAGDVADLGWDIEQPLRFERLQQRPRRPIQAAARWRTRDDLDLTLRPPAHAFFSSRALRLCGEILASGLAKQPPCSRHC